MAIADQKSRRVLAVVLFVVAFCIAVSRINYGIADSAWSAGPGVTTDEVINVAQGVYLNDQILKHGPGLWIPKTTREVFANPDFLPDHPPFGRAVLGFCEMMLSGIFPPAVEGQISINAARIGPCLMFAATVALLFLIVSFRYDQVTAILAAVLLLVMPRMVAHARLGALETATTLTWLLALWIPLTAWTERHSQLPSFRSMVFAGAFWGLLLLTKIQGILMMPIIGLWAVRQFHLRFPFPVIVAGVVGLVVFFVGWPWLLLDPIEHARTYFVKAGDRPTLFAWYFGERYQDKAVPFHFPFVMTAITLPLIVLVGFVARTVQRRFDRFEQLALLSVVMPLIVFALPGTPVYDSVRLFLIIMPLLAFLAARGIVQWVRATTGTSRRLSLAAVAIGVILPLPAVFSPFSLCSYGAQIGGTAGAAALGMEADYWGVGLNSDAWKLVPEGATVMVAPVSHQFQLRDLQLLHPEIQKRNLTLVPYRYTPDEKGLLLSIHRLADLRPCLATVPNGAKQVGQICYGSLPLITILDLKEVQWTEVPDWPQ
ncbi:MAG: glycosyltransferase family 39 protein [Fuerstiella sp.]